MAFTQAPAMPYFAKVGQIEMFSGNTPPSRWMICDGTLISRSTYTDLFGVLGTAYGGGDGETTFAIPDYQGRTPVGVGESEAEGHAVHTLGEYDGEEAHVLITAELAEHTHTYNYLGNTCATNSGSVSTGWYAFSTATSSKTGSNTAHNTMQPFAACTFIIYTGVDETP